MTKRELMNAIQKYPDNAIIEVWAYDPNHDLEGWEEAGQVEVEEFGSPSGPGVAIRLS